MATITVLLDDRARKSGTFPIIVRVSHKGQRRNIPTGISIEAKYWVNNKVSLKHPDAGLIDAKVSEVQGMAKKYLADCSLHNKPVRLDLIGAARQSYSFTGYLKARAKVYKEKKKAVMGRKMDRFILELTEYFGEVYFEDINQDFLRKYEQRLIDNGNNPTTRDKKFRRLGQLFGNAIDEGKAPIPNPFRIYKIESFPVKKEKLSEKDLQAIEDLKLKPGPVNDARNLFLFSYYCKGSRFENCITFRKDQVTDGRVHIHMNKGKKFISVKIHARLQAILDFYKDVPSPYVFPHVKSELPTNEVEYLNAIGSLNTVVNKNLKVVASLAEITVPVSFHIARHTFAYHLKKKTNNINVIQDSLGHGDQKTTQIYLKALDDEILDVEMDKLYGV